MEEIWKGIPGYEGLYQVSNLGRIKMLSKMLKSKNNSLSLRKEKIMKLGIYKGGYLYIDLHHDSHRKKFLIHRLVAQVFIPNQDNKPQVNHIDGNKQNNIVDNLEWTTVSENQIHNFKVLGYKNNFQLNHPDKGKLGKDNRNSKIVLQYTKDLVFIKEWGSIIDVERELFINHSHISQCCSGKLKSSKGFVWRYKD